MEDQTRNSLEEHLQQWRRQYEAQETFSPSQKEELESHLRESAQSLASAGLTEEEAFFIATRRLGQPTALAQQFQTNAGAAWWTRRLLWMLGGIVAYNAVEVVQGFLQITPLFFYGNHSTPELRTICIWRIVIILGSIVLLWLALRREASVSRRAFGKIRTGWWQVLLLISMSVRPIIWTVELIQHPNSITGSPWVQILQLVGSLWPVGWTLLFLMVWRRSRAEASLAPQHSES